MPTVRFFREGIAIECAVGENLRVVALRAGVQIYRTWHVFMNCKGRGKCGSCRIELADPKSAAPDERTPPEHRHLDRRFSDAPTRLACQIRIVTDAVGCTQPLRARMRDATRSFIPRRC